MSRLLTIAGITGLAAIVTVASFIWRDARAYTNFDPCAVTQLSSTAPTTTVDITTTFGVGLDTSTCNQFFSPTERPGQWNFDQLIQFTPLSWVVAKDIDIPDGTLVGSTNSKMVLGLFDNGCQTVLNVPFSLLEGTTNRFGATVAERPLGQPDRLAPMKDNNSDGVPDAALAWPTYLSSVANAFGMNLDYLVSRYVGVNSSSIPGTTVVLNFLVFEPGATVSNKFQVDPALGWPTIVILQDPSSPTSAQDPTSDFCAPIWIQTTLNGSAGGGMPAFRSTNNAGTFNFITFAAPAPDADDDGIENSLDPCPLTQNASGWDPRAFVMQDPGDQDGDGIPDDCDPFPTVKSVCNARVGTSNSDEDCDGWQNRLDNCPLVANANQEDGEHDAIGDACDPDPSLINGNHPSVCIVNTVIIGAGGPPPIDPTTLTPCKQTGATPEPTHKPFFVPAITPFGNCIYLPITSDIVRHPQRHPGWTVLIARTCPTPTHDLAIVGGNASGMTINLGRVNNGTITGNIVVQNYANHPDEAFVQAFISGIPDGCEVTATSGDFFAVVKQGRKKTFHRSANITCNPNAAAPGNYDLLIEAFVFHVGPGAELDYSNNYGSTTSTLRLR